MEGWRKHSALDCLLIAAVRRQEADFASVDQEALLARIQYHGIALLLLDRDISAFAACADLLARVRSIGRMQAAWEEGHRILLQRLLGALAQRQVFPIMLKGTALAYSVYGDPAMRARGDSDLLVRAEERAIAREALAQIGFELMAGPHGLLHQETWQARLGASSPHLFDLHWKAFDSPILQAVLPDAEIRTGATLLPRLCDSALAPRPLHTMLHAAINQATHKRSGIFVGQERLQAGPRLIWGWDIVLLARQFSAADWAELVRLASGRRIAAVCLAALELACRIDPEAVPETVLDRLRAMADSADLQHYLAEPDPVRRFRRDLHAIPSWRGRVAFALAQALPDTAHLRQKYPRYRHWPRLLLMLRWLFDAGLRWRSAGAR